MEATGKARKGRVERASGVLRAHQTSPTIPGHCLCGFKIPGWETIEDHRARMVCGELFSNPLRDTGLRDTAEPVKPHPGGAENLAMHRALKEPLCGACLRYLDEVMHEGRQTRAA